MKNFLYYHGMLLDPILTGLNIMVMKIHQPSTINNAIKNIEENTPALLGGGGPRKVQGRTGVSKRKQRRSKRNKRMSKRKLRRSKRTKNRKYRKKRKTRKYFKN